MVARPDESVVFWDGDTLVIAGGLTLVNVGVHFDGGQVLPWADGEGATGRCSRGDNLQVVSDRRWVSFMYSYPNFFPERPRVIRRALSLLEPHPFARVYGPGGSVSSVPTAPPRSGGRRIAVSVSRWTILSYCTLN